MHADLCLFGQFVACYISPLVSFPAAQVHLGQNVLIMVFEDDQGVSLITYAKGLHALVLPGGPDGQHDGHRRACRTWLACAHAHALNWPLMPVDLQISSIASCRLPSSWAATHGRARGSSLSAKQCEADADAPEDE